MSSRFFDQLAEVRSVLSSSASVEAKFAQIQPMLGDPDIEREFWNLLDDERWIPVLARAGLFKNAPQPESVEGGTRFHSWSASKYLARVAARAPSEVASIFSGITTENVSVIGDMLDAAAAMPLGSAAVLVPAVRRAAAAGILWVHFKDASELCARLAEQGEIDLSLSLAEALFSPTGRTLKIGVGQSDSYWYKEGLKKVTPILTTARADTFVPMLCDWLEALVRSTKNIDNESGDDYSHVWRPAIEEHEQNHDYDLIGAVVGCVRDGFESAISHGGMSLVAAIKLLEDRRLAVFRRLSLHLLAEYGGQELDLVGQTILDRDLFDDYRFKHEYARLVASQLTNIDTALQHEWYRWVDAGPAMSHFDDSVRSNLRREPTDEDRRSRVEYWKFEKLHWLRETLEGPRRHFYERMLSEHGLPEMADLNVLVSGGWAAENPTTVEPLMALTFEDALDTVSSQEPGDPFSLGPGRLLSALTDYIARNPEELSRKARSVEGRPASIVSAYLRQMTAAIEAGRLIDIPAVLELCEWAVGRPIPEGWQIVRDETSALIRAACQAHGDGGIPRFDLEFRSRFWTLVQILCRDRSDSYVTRDKRSPDLRVNDYLMLGMNSARGKAVEAGLDFARWVALHLTASEGLQDAVPGGIQAIPELADLVEWQIDPDNRSLEAMAIIGSRVGVLNWIDERWLANTADRLFDLECVEQHPATAFGWAAWNSFLSWVRPHIVFYRSFEKQFRYAVVQASRVDVDKQDHHQPMFRLGEHLMVLYGRGQLPLAADLVERFLNTARPAIRRHAIGFVSSGLGQEEVPPEIIERFMNLWDLYWGSHGKGDAAADPGAVLFGSWFGSGAFPDTWALSRLHEYVDVVPVPEPDHLVMRQLAEIAQVDIEKSAQIFKRMVKGDREGWRMHGWRDPAMAILEQAIKAGGAAQRDAEEAIDFLGRRGYTAFGALLAR